MEPSVLCQLGCEQTIFPILERKDINIKQSETLERTEIFSEKFLSAIYVKNSITIT